MRSGSECPRIKCVLVGNDGVGKTALLIAYTRNQFPTEYVPDSENRSFLADFGEGDAYLSYKSFESYPYYLTVDDTQLLSELWDMASGEAIDERLLPLSYARTHVFVLCFSVMDPESYENLRTKWALELDHYWPNTPMLVVGTKSDLREDSATVDRLHDRNKAPIQHDQGVAMYKDIGANGYLECSALTSLGVKTVFEHAMCLALQYHREHRRKSDQKCSIL